MKNPRITSGFQYPPCYKMKTRHITFILLLFTNLALFSQTVKELEQQRKATLKQLESSTRILNETQKDKKLTLNKINLLNRNISQRKKLIDNINKEILVLDSEMEKLNGEKKHLQNKLDILKADYAAMVREAYVNRSIYSKIMFVLSAENFDQSWRRLRYIQEFTEYRKQQAAQITKTKNQIEQKTQQMTEHKFTKIEVVNQKRQEASKLTADQKKENKVLSGLSKKEKKLMADIKIQKKKANDLNNKIERIIAEEIRKAEESQKKSVAKDSQKDKSGTPSGSKSSPVYTMTKEEKLLSGSFENNRGRLPWPTDKGFISGRFGVQSHPVLKYITTNNKGIYIQTPAKTNARAVFDGIVTQRFSVPGSNFGVIIKHGQYRTVYANLVDIYVSVGQKVKTKDSIGRIYTDTEDSNKTELYFQIWKDKTILNPEGWISK